MVQEVLGVLKVLFGKFGWFERFGSNGSVRFLRFDVWQFGRFGSIQKQPEGTTRDRFTGIARRCVPGRGRSSFAKRPLARSLEQLEPLEP